MAAHNSYQTADFVVASHRSTMETSETATNVCLSILSVVFMILFCWLTKRQPVPDAMLWSNRRQSAQAAEDPEDRKLRIQKALTVQKVTGCDAEGILQLGSTIVSILPDKEDKVENQTETSTHIASRPSSGAPCNEATQSCCCICLESYEVGEVVSWDRRRRCLHVFHHDCLLVWLEKHNDCPSCRLTILATKETVKPAPLSSGAGADEEDEENRARTNRNEDEEEDASVTSASSASGAFAIVHGLIARVRSGLSKPQIFSSPMKIESPAIFRRRVISFGGASSVPNNWSTVRGSSSTSNETSDEEYGGLAPLQRSVSVNSANCLPSVEDGEGKLRIVETTQPWMADTLLSDEEEDDEHDDEEDNIVRDDRFIDIEQQ